MNTIGLTGGPHSDITTIYPMASGFLYTASSTFTATDMKVWIWYQASGSVTTAIYNSSKQLLSSCGSVALTSGTNEYHLTLGSGVSIVNGSNYYLCVYASTSGSLNYANCIILGGTRRSFDGVWGGSWPASFTDANGDFERGDVYAYDIVVTPVANFTATPLKGTYPFKVAFTDTSTNTPTSWDWDFGDGSAHSTTQNPTHIYTKNGSFTVVLIATNSAGSDTKTATAFITSSASIILGNNY